MVTIDFTELSGQPLARVKWPAVPRLGDNIMLASLDGVYVVEQIDWVAGRNLIAVVYVSKILSNQTGG